MDVARSETAEVLGAGVDGVILPERRSAPITGVVAKTSAGASEHLLLARLPTIGEAIHELKQAGLRLAAAEQEALGKGYPTVMPELALNY